MAGLIYDVPVSGVSLTGGTAQTLIMVTAPTNQRLKILEILCSLNGATSTNAPATLDYGRPSTSGTSSAGTAFKRDSGMSETVQATLGITFTVEPTWTSLIASEAYVPQFNGLYHWMIPFTSPIIIPGGGRFAIRVNSPNNVSASARITVEE